MKLAVVRERRILAAFGRNRREDYIANICGISASRL